MKTKILVPVLFAVTFMIYFVIVPSISKHQNNQRVEKARADSTFFAFHDNFYNWMVRDTDAMRATTERMRMELFTAMERADSLRAEKKKASKKRLFFQLAERIKLLRNAGLSSNSSAILTSDIKVSENDYLLMGSDNSCARRNFPDIPQEELYDFFWFAGDSDLSEEAAGYNATFTQSKDGKWLVDSFRTNLPKPQYQASPEEVAWHYMRLKELRQKDVPRDQRIKSMQAESYNKPWLNMFK